MKYNKNKQRVKANNSKEVCQQILLDSIKI